MAAMRLLFCWWGVRKSLREDLGDAVAELDEHYAELTSAARDRLGRLYDYGD